MPENNVIISIFSRQQSADGPAERIEQRVEGRLEQEGEAWILSYREAPGSGLGESRTTLRVEGEAVTLTRTGETAARMIFRTGQAHRSVYQTPYGALELAVLTHRLSGALTARGGRLEIDYRIELNGQSAGDTRLRLDVRERERTK